MTGVAATVRASRLYVTVSPALRPEALSVARVTVSTDGKLA